MGESSSFELPKPTEKLPYKFILDSLKEEVLHDAPAPVEELAPEASGTEIHEHAQPELPLTEGIEEITAEPTLMADAPLPSPVFELPEGKNYFRIGEAAELIGVEPYVLRYWESEFKSIRPTKSGSGHRVYSRKDVETLNLIRHLVHEQKFSIKGAKIRLSEMKKDLKERKDVQVGRRVEALKEISQELKALIQIARGSCGSL